MGIRKDFNDWIANKIFPKTDSKEIRINRMLALWQVLGSATFTFAGVLMGVGISFMTLGVSFQVEDVSVDNSTQTNPILHDLGESLLEQGKNYLNYGIVLLIFGLLIVSYYIIREK